MSRNSISLKDLDPDGPASSCDAKRGVEVSVVARASVACFDIIADPLEYFGHTGKRSRIFLRDQTQSTFDWSWKTSEGELEGPRVG